MNASRRPTWLLRVVPVEVAEQILVQNVAMGYLSTDVQTSRMRWTEKAGGGGSGRWRCTAAAFTIFSTLKGPTNHGGSFFALTWSGRSLEGNQTF